MTVREKTDRAAHPVTSGIHQADAGAGQRGESFIEESATCAFILHHAQFAKHAETLRGASSIIAVKNPEPTHAMFNEENIDLDSVFEARQESIKRTLEPVSVEKLRELGEKLFPFIDHPWRDPFFKFLDENSGSNFVHGKADDGVEVVYCPAKERGIWFVPKRGLGPLQKRGLDFMKEVTAKR